ncbi:MAG: FeoB-associated Cys-rich membrane protein [Lachnospiraceae bacterium]|nr:FeoB-associated Cys-rich membrane protein [Lachnospiraceae bacterium]MCI7191543.1 FeoB-associated Cys-rich membrane protein [Lachnospiraceae bacterium]MDD7628031.1 FeoB-associated Cys-rich membrane protein [Lachnospiraceae bacterium]MDY4119812.1 FeoB-associated Cys-rich membrane protein [Lachnospiraceae bacterium]
MSTIIVGAIVLLITVLVIRRMIQNKKSGRHCCGDCSHCNSRHVK